MDFAELTDAGRTGLVVLALIVLAAIALLALPALRESLTGDSSGRISAGTSTSAPWVPTIAAFGTVLALNALNVSAGGPFEALLAVVLGVAGAGLVWIVFASVTSRASTPERAFPRQYAQIMDRVRALCVQVECHCPDQAEDPCDACRATREQLAAVRERLRLTGDCAALPAASGGGPQDAPPGPSRAPEAGGDMTWSVGSAYNDLWNGIHRAEEALLIIANRDELLANLLRDRLTVAHSPLAASLEPRLVDIDSKLGDQADEPTVRAQARQLAQVRRAINQFQDGRWDGLQRARARLARSSVITAWTGFALLVLAIALHADTKAITTGGVYFLVGALVGLFAQLRADAKKNEAVEDYGLTAARLNQTVLASGLAGVAGVVLWELAAQQLGGAPMGDASVGLLSIFNVTDKPVRLVVAAAFGLSPQLLIAGLTSRAEQYTADISSFSAGQDTRETAREGSS